MNTDTIKNKIKSVIDYLSELTRINSKITRDLNEYRKILWISDVPKEPKYCFVRAWGAEDELGDTWIEVRKMPEPRLPKVPDQCQQWIKLENLRRVQGIPELEKSIIIECEETNTSTGEIETTNKTLHLQDFADIQKTWEDYINNHWLPWTELYRRYSIIQKVYGDLFLIHQELQKLGEQYELVFCIGLLTWRSPLGHITKRHLITAKASLQFEPHLGQFLVRPSSDGDQVDVEFDMLDLEIQPQNAKQLIENGRRTLRENLWDRPSVDSLLNAIANSLSDSGEGEYQKEQFESKNPSASDKPLIEYAPALILRKRSLRGLEFLLAKMKEQIDAEDEIPHEFLDLCESLEIQDTNETTEDESKKQSLDTEIFFPQLANEEQRRIILTLNRQKGVLVQGPPGTGKTHTIANAICHLLATGKRVLVTAKTQRALQEITDKLPTDIQPLCISLLGSGTEERESLEKSVVGILTQLDKRNELNIEQRIQTLERQLYDKRKSKAEVDKKLMALREAETFKHAIAESAFCGTAAEIARKIKEKEQVFSWFADKINPDTEFPLLQEEINDLYKVIQEFDLETERILSLDIPDPSKDLPDPATLHILFQNNQSTNDRLAMVSSYIQTEEAKVLSSTDTKIIEQLLSALGNFSAHVDSIQKRPMRWISQATHDVLTDRDTPWKELLKLSVDNITGLREIASQVDELHVQIPTDINFKKLLSDATLLKNHIDAGGKFGFWIFRPKAVKEHGSFVGKVKVDGHDCINSETLHKLIDYLRVKQKLEYVWSLWSSKTERKDGPFPLQIAEIEELHEALTNVLHLYDLRENAIAIIHEITGLNKPKWEDIPSVQRLTDICRAILLQRQHLSSSEEIKQLEWELTTLSSRNAAHPIGKELLQAVINRKSTLYSELIDRTHALRQQVSRVQNKKKIINKILTSAPKLANDLSHCSDSQSWLGKIENLQQAWSWARAKSWVEQFLSEDIESLERHSNRLADEIRKDLASLASIRAWNFCFSRMKEDHRRHLMAWQQAMRKLGKGTGKHAYTHRQNAQRHLNECRDAVPAWVMPLHRVYETVEAGPGIFDVIIVDEASQCGPEALPLLYLGKRIIIVGDDKQISPEAVGINREQIQRLMHDYLSDFRHADSFDVENSLFDHGRIRFSNRITLREHFRCMPEIIRFSNDLCYRADPLIPLRQYPPKRLEPLKMVHVASGYREGDGQRAINRPEAEAIVETIIQCCHKEEYEGRTMGVIALQGDAQAYLIESMLLERLGAEEMAKRKLECGNPYHFQGAEREVIFLSMVAAPNERIGALTKATDQRRFNVAASRAQDQVWLFHSVTINHLSEHCFRRRLLEYFLNPQSRITQALGEKAEDLRSLAFRANRAIEKPPSPFDSWFEVDVALDIASRGYRVVPQFQFADKRIDLVVQGLQAQVAVECDGDYWHGPDEYVADVERQRKLERCGWHFFRVRESRYYSSRDIALNDLWVILENRGIVPIAMENTIAVPHQKENGFNLIEDDEESFEDTDEQLDDNENNTNKVELSISTADHHGNKSTPTTIEEALQAKSDLIGKHIVEILNNRPNNSCMREKMATYLLKSWNIRTRSSPRHQFAQKINNIIAVMARKGYLVIYKSVNERIKLGWEKYPI